MSKKNYQLYTVTFPIPTWYRLSLYVDKAIKEEELLPILKDKVWDLYCQKNIQNQGENFDDIDFDFEQIDEDDFYAYETDCALVKKSKNKVVHEENFKLPKSSIFRTSKSAKN